MIPLNYDIIIEATEDPLFFSFYSTDLKGFTGVGSSVEDCIYKAIHGIEEHIEEMQKLGLTVPPVNLDAKITVLNSVIAPEVANI